MPVNVPFCYDFSIFKHYKLYEYMFSHTQAEELIGADVSIL